MKKIVIIFFGIFLLCIAVYTEIHMQKNSHIAIPYEPNLVGEIDGIFLTGSEQMDVTHLFAENSMGIMPGTTIKIDGNGQTFYFVDSPEVIGDVQNSQSISRIERDEDGQEFYFVDALEINEE